MITQTQARLPNSFHSCSFHCNANFPAHQTFNFHIFMPHTLSVFIISSFSVLLTSAHCFNFRKFQCNIGQSTQLLTSLPTDVTKLRLDARYRRLYVCVFASVCVCVPFRTFYTDSAPLRHRYCGPRLPFVSSCFSNVPKHEASNRTF